jgi:phosphoglycolate phosphatase-like HAD superfamily hydrolase
MSRSIIAAMAMACAVCSAFQTHPANYVHLPSTRLWTSPTSTLGDASKFTGGNSPLPLNPKGIIFDMDGTLIQHSIDFADMRRRIYEVADADPIGRDLERDCVLALAKQLSAEGQEKANMIFADIEKRAVDDMTLMPGGVELLSFLKENNLECAVLTRNIEKNVQHMQQLYLNEIEHIEGQLFDPLVARDTVVDYSGEPLKSKPHPDGILYVCSVWGCNSSQVIMVGDSANDDMAAANRAGCGGAVLLTQPDGTSLDTDSGYQVGYSEEEVWERRPSLRVESLCELKTYLQVLLKDRRENDETENRNDVGFVYSTQGYSFDIPSIGAKQV